MHINRIQIFKMVLSDVEIRLGVTVVVEEMDTEGLPGKMKS